MILCLFLLPLYLFSAESSYSTPIPTDTPKHIEISLNRIPITPEQKKHVGLLFFAYRDKINDKITLHDISHLLTTAEIKHFNEYFDQLSQPAVSSVVFPDEEGRELSDWCCGVNL